MYCKVCGKKLNGTEKFCSDCGSQIDYSEELNLGDPSLAGDEGFRLSRSAFRMGDMGWDLDGYPTEDKKTDRVDFDWASVLEGKEKKAAEDRRRAIAMTEEDIYERIQADRHNDEFDWNLVHTMRIDRSNRGGLSLFHEDDEELFSVDFIPPLNTAGSYESMSNVSSQAPSKGTVVIDKIDKSGIEEAATQAAGIQERDYAALGIDVNAPADIPNQQPKRKIEKFYTFNRKNEEFQALLDEEYERIRQKVQEQAEQEELKAAAIEGESAVVEPVDIAGEVVEPAPLTRGEVAKASAEAEADEAERLAAEAERLAAEAEAKAKAAEEAAAKAAAEAKAAEDALKAMEEEEARIAAEEAARKAAEEEAARIAAEEEAARKAAEEEAARIAAEEEAARKAAEEEAARIAAEEEAARIAAEEEARKEAELLAAEEAARQAEEEVARAEEVARQAEENARVAEEEARLAEEARIAEETRIAEEARISAEEEAARKAAEEARIAEEARVAEEARLAEEARVTEEARAAEEEAARLAAVEEAARKAAAEESSRTNSEATRLAMEEAEVDAELEKLNESRMALEVEAAKIEAGLYNDDHEEEEIVEETKDGLRYGDIFDNEDDDDDYGEKRHGCRTLFLDFLIVILALAVAAACMLIFLPEHPISKKIKPLIPFLNNGTAPVEEPVETAENTENTETTQETTPEPVPTVSETATAISKVMAGITNIGSVTEDPSLMFTSGTDYGVEGVDQAGVFTNATWFNNDAGEPVTYMDAVVGTVLEYYSKLMNKLNQDDNAVMELVAEDSQLYGALNAISANQDITHEIESIKIGEVRANGWDFYVLATVTEKTSDSEEADITTKIIHLLANNEDHSIKVVDIVDVQ